MNMNGPRKRRVRPPPYPGDEMMWSAEQIGFFILPMFLRNLADILDKQKVDVNTEAIDAIREGADEIDRLRRKYEPEWAVPE